MNVFGTLRSDRFSDPTGKSKVINNRRVWAEKLAGNVLIANDYETRPFCSILYFSFDASTISSKWRFQRSKKKTKQTIRADSLLKQTKIRLFVRFFFATASISIIRFSFLFDKTKNLSLLTYIRIIIERQKNRRVNYTHRNARCHQWTSHAPTARRYTLNLSRHPSISLVPQF